MERKYKAKLNLLNVDKTKWREGCSYFGTFMISLTLGFFMYWGNLAVYTESYFRHRLGQDPEITLSWIPSLRMIGKSLGFIVAGYIAQVIGLKWNTVVACVLLDSMTFLASFCLDQPLIYMDLSFGLVAGVGGSMAFTCSLQNAFTFQPKRQGLVTGFIISGTSVGAACLNQIITWYINPANLTPDLCDGHQSYFTQKDILERVPSMFLILGFIQLGCHVLGISLMRSNLKRETEAQEDIPIHEYDACDTEDSNDKSGSKETGCTSSRNLPVSVEKNETSQTRDVSPGQMLRTATFYILWFDVFCTEYSYIVFLNFYKIYGETRIPDDTFLTSLATVSLFVSLLMRPIWGGFMDSNGVKHTILVLCCIISVSSNFWYFTAIVSRWLYFIWTMMVDCVSCGFFLIFSVATHRLFGKEHFSKNFGVVMSSSLILNLLAPTLMKMLVTGYGWFYLFFSVGCVNAVGLVLSVLWLPRK